MVRVTRVERGQLVLVAAAVAALALVPVVAAYLQFGYAPAVADTDADHPSRVSRALDSLADDAAERATGADWSDRERAVKRLRESLGPRLRTVERARLGDGIVANASYDSMLADGVACPGGAGRSFGACENVGGVVVQERDGETVVVAIAFEVRVTTPSGTVQFERVVRPR
ncbi:DUF7261 family protein [Halobacterium litoreum]|uniref:Uncharacterized protein n=1 Tax=Halobacterium litoreum TaxID=2039234 RepID=A0ABD5NHH6_9EURY|nr:hypothetical protein [Halobacterium litoreum]UHH12826.1 hypothetical protein LT972_11740 [Halobacterium litoreum]